MPVMNGVELIRAMRDDPALEQLPIIVQTSDQPALKAPVWRDLHVSQLVDKYAFLDWFCTQVEEHTRHAS
jgi:CheY-like chemotaxis protein